MRRYDLSFITKRYFDDFEDPSVINDGWCYVWAWMARVHRPRLELATYIEHYDGSTHALIVDSSGRYYDSGAPRGTFELAELDYWASDLREGIPPPDPKRVHIRTPEKFRADWGAGHNFDDQGLPRWCTRPLTKLQCTVFSKVRAMNKLVTGPWYRAQSNGERVTLASLFYADLLQRRAWRTAKCRADNAYEYWAPYFSAIASPTTPTLARATPAVARSHSGAPR